MSKIKNGGLDQYGAGPFEQQQFGPAGTERVNWRNRYGSTGRAGGQVLLPICRALLRQAKCANKMSSVTAQRTITYNVVSSVVQK